MKKHRENTSSIDLLFSPRNIEGKYRKATLVGIRREVERFKKQQIIGDSIRETVEALIEGYQEECSRHNSPKKTEEIVNLFRLAITAGFKGKNIESIVDFCENRTQKKLNHTSFLKTVKDFGKELYSRSTKFKKTDTGNSFTSPLLPIKKDEIYFRRFYVFTSQERREQVTKDFQRQLEFEIAKLFGDSSRAIPDITTIDEKSQEYSEKQGLLAESSNSTIHDTDLLLIGRMEQSEKYLVDIKSGLLGFDFNKIKQIIIEQFKLKCLEGQKNSSEQVDKITALLSQSEDKLPSQFIELLIKEITFRKVYESYTKGYCLSDGNLKEIIKKEDELQITVSDITYIIKEYMERLYEESKTVLSNQCKQNGIYGRVTTNELSFGGKLVSSQTKSGIQASFAKQFWSALVPEVIFLDLAKRNGDQDLAQEIEESAKNHCIVPQPKSSCTRKDSFI